MSVMERVGNRLLELLQNAFMGAALEQQFQQLAYQWRAETAFLSSTSKIIMHPSYQRIIGMGPGAIRPILRDLQQTQSHWFWALTAITGEDPTSPQDAGHIDKMVEAWLTWGKDKGYI